MTTLFILGTIILIAGFDLYTWKKRGVESTITRNVRRWAGRFPFVRDFIAFAMGVLFGHLFF